jgi:hypothetical protein
VEDTHVWRFSGDGHYSAKSAYESLFLGMVISDLMKGFGKLRHLGNAVFSCG